MSLYPCDGWSTSVAQWENMLFTDSNPNPYITIDLQFYDEWFIRKTLFDFVQNRSLLNTTASSKNFNTAFIQDQIPAGDLQLFQMKNIAGVD